MPDFHAPEIRRTLLAIVQRPYNSAYASIAFSAETDQTVSGGCQGGTLVMGVAPVLQRPLDGDSVSPRRGSDGQQTLRSVRGFRLVTVVRFTGVMTASFGKAAALKQ